MGTWLTFRRSITSDMRQGAAEKLIDTYFEQLGYRQLESTPSRKFARGASLAGFYSMNPRSLQTYVTVDLFSDTLGNTVIEVEMRVNRRGNLPLSKDYDFWQAELVGLSTAVHYGLIDPTLSVYAAERAFWYSVSVTLAAAGLIFAVTAAVMVFYFSKIVTF